MIIGLDGSRSFAGEKTGTENYSFQLLKALAKIDRKNKYVVYLRSSYGSPIRSGMTKEKFPDNFHFVTINWAKLWTQGGLALKTFQQDLDVLFVPAHTLPVIRKPGLKTVVTVHDLGSEYLPQHHQLKQRLYLGFMQKYQLKSATKLIAVSKATKEDLIKRAGIDPNKIKVIYEGYDKEKFQIPNSKFQKDTLINSLKQYDLAPGEYFLFVGTVQPRKNLERVIRAFAIYSSNEVRSHLKNYNSFQGRFSLRSNNKLVIVGQKGWLTDKIYKLPKKLGIEERVKFLGYVPEENLPALYSGAIALVFPSLFEGFGLPILEAQACGCPLITSNISSMPEVAGKGAILVDPYDVDAIAHAMIRVQGTGYRVQLIKRGLENVKRFSWEKCARETLKVLEEVTNRL